MPVQRLISMLPHTRPFSLSRIRLEAYELGQFPLIGVKRQKFARATFQGGGDVKDIEGPMAARQGMGARKTSCLVEDIGQVAGNHHQSA